MTVGFSLCNDFHGFCFVAEVGWLYLESCDVLGLVVLVCDRGNLGLSCCEGI